MYTYGLVTQGKNNALRIGRCCQIPATSVAEDHQMKNARAMAEGGAATILPERDLVAERLATVILNILGAAYNSSCCFMFHEPLLFVA